MTSKQGPSASDKRVDVPQKRPEDPRGEIGGQEGGGGAQAKGQESGGGSKGHEGGGGKPTTKAPPKH